MSRFFLITVQGWGQMLGTFGSSEWGALLLSPRLFCNRAHWTDQKHDQFNLHRKSWATQPRWRIKLKCLKCNRGGTAKYHSQGALMGLVKSLQAIFSKQLYIPEIVPSASTDRDRECLSFKHLYHEPAAQISTIGTVQDVILCWYK